MIEHLVIGLHATSITLKLIVAFAATRLMFYNLGLYLHPWSQNYETLMKMSLWLSIPVLVVGALISRALNLWYYVDQSSFLHDPWATVLVLVYLGMTISGLLAALVYINYVAYGRRRGCWTWLVFFATAAMVGVTTACITAVN